MTNASLPPGLVWVEAQTIRCQGCAAERTVTGIEFVEFTKIHADCRKSRAHLPASQMTIRERFALEISRWGEDAPSAVSQADELLAELAKSPAELETEIFDRVAMKAQERFVGPE